DDKYELFIAILTHAIELFVPVSKKRLRESNLPPFLERLSIKRENAWVKAKTSNTAEYWESFKRIQKPVSITSVFARLFEKTLKKHIVLHLEDHSVISPYQHGFQKGKSTVTAMIQVLNDWTKYLDEGKNVDVIYFDFLKAFDRVPHEKLLHKMYVVGIHPRIIAWLRSFLSERKFIVRVNSSFSKPRIARSGVPQGGVLSPILFNIYTYDLLKLLSMSNVAQSAIPMQFLECLDSWGSCHSLPRGFKSKVLHLGSRNGQHSYTIDGTILNSVHEVQDLGFLVTDNPTLMTLGRLISQRKATVLDSATFVSTEFCTKERSILITAGFTFTLSRAFIRRERWDRR
ncbi:reverse transcriptase, partial [Cooperia oncophora]